MTGTEDSTSPAVNCFCQADDSRQGSAYLVAELGISRLEPPSDTTVLSLSLEAAEAGDPAVGFDQGIDNTPIPLLLFGRVLEHYPSLGVPCVKIGP